MKSGIRMLKKLALAAFLAASIPVYATASIADIDGHTAIVGTFGELLTGTLVPDVQISFDSELNTTYDVTTAVTGDGAAALVGQTAQASSTTGTSRIESKNSIRYRAGHTGLIRFTASFVGNGTGYAGGFNSTSGFYLKRAAGVSSFCYRHGANNTCNTIPDKTPSQFVTSWIDWTKLNIFEIQYGYLGVANPVLIIYTNSGRQKISEIETINSLTDAHSGAPVFPVAIETAGAMTIKAASWSAGTIGSPAAAGVGRPFHFNSTGTLNAANLSTIVNFKNSATRATALGADKARLVQMEFFVDTPSGSAVGTVEFKIYKNATLSGAGSYTAVSNGNSLMEYDTSVTYSSAGILTYTDWAGWIGSTRGNNAGGEIIDAEKLGLVALPGDVFTITAQNVGTGTDNVRWRVRFNWEEF